MATFSQLLSLFICIASFLTGTAVLGSKDSNHIKLSKDDFEFYHVLPSNPLQKLNSGWQQPGLLRPKYIVERKFFATGDKKECFNRIRIKFCEDGSVYVFGKRRPMVSLVDSFVFRSVSNSQDSDGAWTYRSAFNSKDLEFDVKQRNGKQRELHFSTVSWGQLDEMTSSILPGRIYFYDYNKDGMPIGNRLSGTFQVKYSPHRPLLHKGFQAFQ